MSYLLDSNILIWARLERRRILPAIISLLENPRKKVSYSIITPWELSIKYMKGKIILPKNFFTTLSRPSFDCLPIEEHHITALRSLPHLHGDPFDRMLVAQAIAENMTIITADAKIAAYPVKTLLAK